MPLDGVFIHHLVNELNGEIANYKVNKIYQPSPSEIMIQLRGRNNQTLFDNKQLYFNCSLDSPKLYLTQLKFLNADMPFNFCMLLRKYLDRAIIQNVSQIENDRIVEITFKTANELGDSNLFKIIFELMGRNSNIILINSDNIIVDALRKLVPSETNQRTILPRAQYLYPLQKGFINPFEITNLASSELSILQGCSKILINELKEHQIINVQEFLSKEIIPTLFVNKQKIDYYCKSLSTISYDQKKEFSTFSQLLETVSFYHHHQYDTDNHSELRPFLNQNYQVQNLIKQVKKIIQTKQLKIANLEQDLENAHHNTIYTHLGILLQANLYLVKPKDQFIEVEDYLNDSKKVVIELNPMLSAGDNLKHYFSKGKKAETAIHKVNQQLTIVKNEREYLELILDQLNFASFNDYEEIKQELIDNQILKKKKTTEKKKKKKINIQKITFNGLDIFVGKNNIQNEYLIHHLAKSNDFWFHVKDAPGAHIVISVPHNDSQYLLTEPEIRLASNIAGYFSKMQLSSSVAVDYTRIKHLKKIPGKQGYNVTYTNQKTIYIDPDVSLIKQYKLL